MARKTPKQSRTRWTPSELKQLAATLPPGTRTPTLAQLRTAQRVLPVKRRRTLRHVNEGRRVVPFLAGTTHAGRAQTPLRTLRAASARATPAPTVSAPAKPTKRAKPGPKPGSRAKRAKAAARAVARATTVTFDSRPRGRAATATPVFNGGVFERLVDAWEVFAASQARIAAALSAPGRAA